MDETAEAYSRSCPLLHPNLLKLSYWMVNGSGGVSSSTVLFSAFSDASYALIYPLRRDTEAVSTVAQGFALCVAETKDFVA